MVDTPKPEELPLPTRVAVLEAKVRLLSIVMKWLIGLMVTSLLAYVLGVKL
jgi:tetrahydromethanopterin S-methyltransferase subunit B